MDFGDFRAVLVRAASALFSMRAGPRCANQFTRSLKSLFSMRVGPRAYHSENLSYLVRNPSHAKPRNCATPNPDFCHGGPLTHTLLGTKKLAYFLYNYRDGRSSLTAVRQARLPFGCLP